MTTDPDELIIGYGEAEGLTKREYFAALAMQGLLASGADLNSTAIAASAVELSDKLIKWLNPAGEGQADG